MSESSCLIVSDFNASNLRGYLSAGHVEPQFSTRLNEFGQVMPVLLNGDHDLWSPRPELLVVWVKPEAISAEFAGLLNGKPVSEREFLAETDQFIDAVLSCCDRAGSIVIPLFAVSPFRRGLGAGDHRAGGLSRSLHEMNHRLITRLGDEPNIFLIAPESWLQGAQQSHSVDKFWYASKSPFSLKTYGAVAEACRAVIRAARGRARKLLVVDLDETLWGGVVGDVGWQGIRLGGHDPVGEAFKDFQQGLLSLHRKGVAIAVVSKNDESVALQAMRSHPEMLLRPELLAGWKINWDDKAQNIVDLVAELNLGLDSAVFVDDNPAERGRVSEALPGVMVPDWPTDPLLYRHCLEQLDCFDQVQITAEDRLRSASYAARRSLVIGRPEVSSEEWIRSLNVRVQLTKLHAGNRARIVQLLNKTNQMNLSTRRMTEDEFIRWLDSPENGLVALSASDRFAELGLVGILSFSKVGTQLRIVDLVLSCRAFGRSLENLLLWKAVEIAREKDTDCVFAEFVRTEKNGPTWEFLATRSGWVEQPTQSGRFEWPTSESFTCPEHITITEPIDAADERS